jgi:2-phospho-L-lactate/phosphoenolpyruvate guanylyltransferase
MPSVPAIALAADSFVGADRGGLSLPDTIAERYPLALRPTRRGGASLSGSATMARSRLWAVLPVKDLQHAKQRLAGALGADERRALFRAMLEDVLSALSASDGLAGILVVTRDPDAQRLAADYGARVLVEPQNRGHTAASTLGAQTLAEEGACGMVQVPADLPLLTPADIGALLQIHGEAPAVTLAPSRDERGSNAVACSPPDLLPLRFGDDSFLPHLQRAQALVLEPQIVRRQGFAIDVDTADDLAAFVATPSQTRAYRYLAEAGIAARMTAPTRPAQR